MSRLAPLPRPAQPLFRVASAPSLHREQRETRSRPRRPRRRAASNCTLRPVPLHCSGATAWWRSNPSRTGTPTRAMRLQAPQLLTPRHHTDPGSSLAKKNRNGVTTVTYPGSRHRRKPGKPDHESEFSNSGLRAKITFSSHGALSTQSCPLFT